MAKKVVTKENAKTRLESVCARSEQCESDLITKMVNWGINCADRNEILDHLRENRFVDNRRFAISYARDKARFSYWGPGKIRVELIKKRIPAILINEAIGEVEQQTWKEGLIKNALSKAKNLDLAGEEGYESRQKLYRYLLSRGFPSSACSKMVTLMKKRQEGEV